MDAAAVHDDLRHPAPVHRFPVPADDGLRHHRHVAGGVHKPGVIFFGFLCRCPGPAAASSRLLADNAGDVLPGVAQRHGHVFRLFALVLPGQLRDPLRDGDAKIRQRHPAPPPDGQPVQVFPGFPAQIQAADGDGHDGLTVPLQAIQRPQAQHSLRLLALVGFHLVFPAPYALVLAQVVPSDMQVLFSDGVDAGVHIGAVYRPPHGGDIPAHAHFAGVRRADMPDMQLEGQAAQIVLPARIVQGAGDLFHSGKKIVAVEGIRGAVRVLKVAQRPNALTAQHILGRLLRRTRSRSAVSRDVARLHFSEDAYIPQGVDNVLQGVGAGAAVENAVVGLDPPHDARARLLIVQ